MDQPLRCFARLAALLTGLLLTGAAAAQPVITRLAPVAGPAGASVVISGSGFAAAAGRNAVHFGPARATITAATATQLTVLVPVGAASVAPVTVVNLDGQRLGSSLTSATPFFTLTFAGPGLNAGSYQATNYFVATSRVGLSALATADLNEDSFLDFALIGDGRLLLQLSDGQGGYEAPLTLAAGTGPAYIQAADTDADGHADLLVNGAAGAELLLLRNLGGGRGFTTPAVLSLGGQRLPNPNFSTIDVQDMDGDGRPDLVTTTTVAGDGQGVQFQVVLLRNNGAGFDPPTVLLRERLLGQVVADFNQDGRPDVVAIGQGIQGGAATRLLLLTRNAANSGFEAPVITNLSSSVAFVGAPFVADLNGDGRPDLVANGQAFVSGQPSEYGLFAARGTAGGFELRGPFAPTGITGPVIQRLNGVIDADGDGRPDALASIGNSFAVLRGQAGGDLGSPISYGPAGRVMVSGDFDNDGRTDVAAYDAESGNLAIFRYTGAAAGTNNPPTLNALTNLVLDEDAPQQTVALSGISNGGEAGQAVRLSAVSSDPSLVPNPTISYFSPTATGTLRLRPAPNAFGTCTITVTASDGQSQQGLTTRTFQVTVNPVNDAPTLDAIPDVVITTVETDSRNIITALSGITSGAANENQVLSLGYQVSRTSSNGLVENGTFTYTSPATTGTFSTLLDVAGAPRLLATVTITVSDGQPTNSTSSRTFRVFYNPGGTAPNQPASAPTLDAVADVTASRALLTQAALPLTGIGDGDPTRALPLTVTASSSDPDLVSPGAVSYASPAATGTLPYAISATRGGTAVISVTVSNGQAQNGSLTRSFRVTVPAPALVSRRRPAAAPADLHLSPNPARAGGRCYLSGAAPGPVEVTLLDLSGRLVLTRRLPAAAAPTPLDLPPTLPAGTYLLRVRTDQGTATRRLLLE